jgi:hypothetical protein
VSDLLVMLSYDSPEVHAAAREAEVTLHALLTVDGVLAAAPLTEADRQEVARFRADPPHWRPE